MTASIISSSASGSSGAIDYPSGDGQPVAETFAHLYAIMMTIELLRLYLEGTRATVLGNQSTRKPSSYPSRTASRLCRATG